MLYKESERGVEKENKAPWKILHQLTKITGYDHCWSVLINNE